MVDSPRSKAAVNDDLERRLAVPAAAISQHTALIADAGAALDDAMQRDIAAMGTAAQRLQTQVDVLMSALPDDSDIDLSTLRHDMRNTLGALLGYVEMLADDQVFTEGTPADVGLKTVWRESRNLVAMLDALSHRGGERRMSAGIIEHIFRGSEHVASARAQTTPGIILVADDDAGNRSLLANQLRRGGHTVYEAANGAETLQAVVAHSPEIILLDLIMPDMSGYEVLQKLRGEKLLGACRVIMISGMSDEDSAVRCIEGGASDYLTKPVNSTLLRARLGALLERVAWDRKEKAYSEELQKSRDFIRGVFGRYLSDEIVQSLLDKPDGLDLGGKTQRVSILMSDVRGFSQISRELPPPQLIALLNNYLGPMTDIIMDYGGTVDEFVGDSILAIFGAPLEKAGDCDRAVACAIAMQNAMQEVNARNRRDGLPQIEMGIGVNTGDVVVGNIGSERRSKFGIVGHQVNLTSRIEACTVGGQILISQTCLDGCLAPVTISNSMTVSFKGSRSPLPLHDLTGIGGDYNLQLQAASEEPSQPAGSSGRNVEIRLLQTKLGDGETLGARICKFGRRTLMLEVDRQLPALTDISVTFDQTDERGNRYMLYAKVTGAQESLTPVLTVTSTPLPLAQLLGDGDD